MVAIIIMSLQQKKRLRLITPARPIKGKVLKSCIRCRQHKTKCDASSTNPFPCTQCYKKNTDCTLDIITSTPKRSYDVLEKLTNEVHELRDVLDRIIERKNQTIKLLVDSGKQIQKINSVPNTPSVSEIQSCLNSPTNSPIQKSIDIDPIPTNIINDSFTINSNKQMRPISISFKQCEDYFKNYYLNYNKFLPILPNSLFENLNLRQIYRENDLLFWSIIITSKLSGSNTNEYFDLANHIKNLVVYKCWLNTPRDVYTLASLLILTTWPLPMIKLEKLQDNLSIKYLSLMKNLSLQLGLHKLEFINEFSHKTNMNISSESDLNNLIRERIYKFININSNYWLVYLGLSNSNYNGFQQDYIINKSANIDLFNNSKFNHQDNFINSLLKISLIQSKLNENMNDLINQPNNVSKLININMFEIILNDFQQNDKLIDDNLIRLSIEFTKLQLFTYAFSNVDLNIHDYKIIIYKAIQSCNLILQLWNLEFTNITNFNQLPIHYKFIIETVLLVLLRIFSSPLLNSVDDYKFVQNLFNKSFGILTKNSNRNWLLLNSKLIKIISKFNKLNNISILNSNKDTFFLVNKMKDYLVSSLHYELIYLIYDNEFNNKNNDSSSGNSNINDINWEIYVLFNFLVMTIGLVIKYPISNTKIVKLSLTLSKVLLSKSYDNEGWIKVQKSLYLLIKQTTDVDSNSVGLTNISFS
ncbi:hypothetical protein HYPBUDRAFT_161948 [Hyphopichia burtonii NRRL Y-1933]|uniref:Zn(2)-C6 fungal-type domain-containing protein n=1 Tax=Hyphopichia burtonii NRRL Y-1933 TaxID=984485 RepID=A0A1E4RIH6_9ASCO|nr:hypothetical protein HYPBUDRAFT_161948 [Hyphopichia burtonii NRRL Y-1933]ODV67074.1 hypothetical protein HYPBUDRAFT_161948 [Hyphopichia burtonii NRRL Y-1933]